jgi:hypothetical protein
MNAPTVPARTEFYVSRKLALEQIKGLSIPEKELVYEALNSLETNPYPEGCKKEVRFNQVTYYFYVTFGAVKLMLTYFVQEDQGKIAIIAVSRFQ